MTRSDVRKGPDSGLGPSGPDQGVSSPPSLFAGPEESFQEPRRLGRTRFESERDRLLGEIFKALDGVDEAGLIQILDTVAVIRYNQSLLNASEDAQGQELPFEEVREEKLRIERSRDGSTYHLLLGKAWKILAAEEIAALLRIARHEESESEAAKHLYQWIRQERRDIAVDLHIPNASTSLLREFLALLRETFPVRTARRI